MQSWIFLTVIFVAAVGLWFSSGSTKAAKPGRGTACLCPRSGETSHRRTVARRGADAPQRNGDRRPKCGGKCTFESTTNHRRAVQRNLREPKQTIRRRQKSIDGIPHPIADEERKREYAGRFASNVALSYRSDPRAGVPGAQTATSAISSLTNGPGEPQSLATPATVPGLPADFQQQLNLLQAQQEKLLAQEQQQLAKLTGVPGGSETQGQPQTPTAPARRNADLNRATGKDHVLSREQYLNPCCEPSQWRFRRACDLPNIHGRLFPRS